MSALKRQKPVNEEEWKKARSERGIGASEAAAIVGMSPWTTTRELWEIKTGTKKPTDISDNPLVEQGHRMEDAVRGLYRSYHPDYKIRYNQYDLLFQKELPWLFCTLDGEVTDQDGRNGILEIKTATPMSKAEWSKWDQQIPQQYMVQILHQLLATGWEFVDLMALLINSEGDFTVRTYHFERADHEEDLTWLLEKETAFWDSVQSKSLPPMTLIL